MGCGGRLLVSGGGGSVVVSFVVGVDVIRRVWWWFVVGVKRFLIHGGANVFPDVGVSQMSDTDLTMDDLPRCAWVSTKSKSLLCLAFISWDILMASRLTKRSHTGSQLPVRPWAHTSPPRHHHPKKKGNARDANSRHERRTKDVRSLDRQQAYTCLRRRYLSFLPYLPTYFVTSLPYTHTPLATKQRTRTNMTRLLLGSLFLLVALTSPTQAFAPRLGGRPTTTTTTLRLTADEILARSRQAVGMPADSAEGPPDALPLLFDEDLLTDLQSALLKLERRVQEGPGALTASELDELDGELQRMVAELHANPDRRHAKPVRKVEAATVVASSSSSEEDAAMPAAATPPPAAESPEPATIDTDTEEDGAVYDGSGGMGQPRGTVNTYILEGMEDMTSDEYRLALQQSLIDRQAARRGQAGARVGNQGTLDYLHMLSGPGAKDSLKRDAEDEEEPKNWSGWQK